MCPDRIEADLLGGLTSASCSTTERNRMRDRLPRSAGQSTSQHSARRSLLAACECLFTRHSEGALPQAPQTAPGEAITLRGLPGRPDPGTALLRAVGGLLA